LVAQIGFELKQELKRGVSLSFKFLPFPLPREKGHRLACHSPVGTMAGDRVDNWGYVYTSILTSYSSSLVSKGVSSISLTQTFRDSSSFFLVFSRALTPRKSTNHPIHQPSFFLITALYCIIFTSYLEKEFTNTDKFFWLTHLLFQHGVELLFCVYRSDKLCKNSEDENSARGTN
jgi:hypothetical protein